MEYTTLYKLKDMLQEQGFFCEDPVHDASRLFAESDVSITGAECDSRLVQAGQLFIAKGEYFKSKYLVQAEKLGASCYLCDESIASELFLAAPSLPRLVVRNVRNAMTVASVLAWGEPASQLHVVGITGTKGKTTTATLLSQLLAKSQNGPVALLGTHDAFDGREHIETLNTTPEAPQLFGFLRKARNNGCTYVVMEVSSQGLKYGRVSKLQFQVACFLNISPDHISPREHPIFDDYFSSKRLIFKHANMVVVPDNGIIYDAAQESVRSEHLLTFGLDPHASIYVKDLLLMPAGSSFKVCGLKEQESSLNLALPGKFNVENAVAALACAQALGLSAETIVAAAKAVLPTATVPGRMERYASDDGKLIAYVDYAHNKLSYQEFFNALYVSEHVDRHVDYVIAAFGVCGDRALDRWFDLPQVASEYCDFLEITSDEPGPEDPQALAEKVAANVPAGVAHVTEADRDKAVDDAFAAAVRAISSGKRAIVCLLGKGRESSMLIGQKSVEIEPDSTHAPRLIAQYNAGKLSQN